MLTSVAYYCSEDYCTWSKAKSQTDLKTVNNLTRIGAQNAMQNGQIPLSGKMQISFSTQNHLFLKETKSVAFKPAMQNFYNKCIPFN